MKFSLNMPFSSVCLFSFSPKIFNISGLSCCCQSQLYAPKGLCACQSPARVRWEREPRKTQNMIWTLERVHVCSTWLQLKQGSWSTTGHCVRVKIVCYNCWPRYWNNQGTAMHCDRSTAHFEHCVLSWFISTILEAFAVFSAVLNTGWGQIESFKNFEPHFWL